MTSSYLSPDIYEVVVLLRNKRTGEESALKLEDSTNVSIDLVPEVDQPDPFSFYNDTVQIYPMAQVQYYDFVVEGRALRYRVVKDTSNVPEGDTETWL